MVKFYFKNTSALVSGIFEGKGGRERTAKPYTLYKTLFAVAEFAEALWLNYNYWQRSVQSY